MEMFIVPINPMEGLSTTGKEPITAAITVPFQNILSDAISGLEAAREVTKEDNYNLATGNINDLAQLQINSMKASYMMQTTVQLTSRTVNAYKEIMQMQV